MPNPIRRRRLGGGAGFTPKRLPGLVFWVKAESLGLSDGTTIQTWTDLSGNGNDLTQLTAGNRPTYKVNIQNGLPVVRFAAAATSFMDTPSFALSQPSTLASAFTARGSPGKYVADSVTVVDQRDFFIQADTTLQMYCGTVFNITVPTMLNVFHAAVLVYNGAASVGNFDGVETTGDVGGSNGTGIRLGRSGGGSTVYGDVDVGEFIAYARVLSAPERALIQAYLKRRWGTP